jgi:hypothetical protein
MNSPPKKLVLNGPNWGGGIPSLATGNNNTTSSTNTTHIPNVQASTQKFPISNFNKKFELLYTEIKNKEIVMPNLIIALVLWKFLPNGLIQKSTLFLIALTHKIQKTSAILQNDSLPIPWMNQQSSQTMGLSSSCLP